MLKFESYKMFQYKLTKTKQNQNYFDFDWKFEMYKICEDLNLKFAFTETTFVSVPSSFHYPCHIPPSHSLLIISIVVKGGYNFLGVCFRLESIEFFCKICMI